MSAIQCRLLGRVDQSLDRQPEESAAPGGSVDNHPAESLDLLRLTVQRSGNPPVSVWATVHCSRASRPGVPYRWTVTVKRRHAAPAIKNCARLRSAHTLTHPPPALMALPGPPQPQGPPSRDFLGVCWTVSHKNPPPPGGSTDSPPTPSTVDALARCLARCPVRPVRHYSEV